MKRRENLRTRQKELVRTSGYKLKRTEQVIVQVKKKIEQDKEAREKEKTYSSGKEEAYKVAKKQ